MIPTDIRTLQDRILECWQARPCSICHRRGICDHREYDVELAIVEAQMRAAVRPAKREPELAVTLRRRRA